MKTRPENNFKIDPQDIIDAVTDKTQAIVINSPNNPMGAVYPESLLAPIVELCIKKSIWLVSDDVYQSILAPEYRSNPVNIVGASEVCISVCSLSKSHRMTGWRIGWVVAPESLIKHLYNLSLCMSYGLVPFILDAADFALRHDVNTADQVRRDLDERRNVVRRILSNIDGLNILISEGGMFVVLDIRAFPVSSKQFSRQLLDKYDVSILPCDGFGDSTTGFLRISLCVEPAVMVVACNKIVDCIDTLR